MKLICQKQHQFCHTLQLQSMFSAISSYQELRRVGGLEEYKQKWGGWMVHITVLLDVSTMCNYPLRDVNTQT